MLGISKFKIFFATLSACGALACIGLTQCTQQSKVVNELEQGRMLSKKYCQSCHKYPEANLVDKKHWEQNILPAMGTKMGLTYWGSGYFAGRQSMVSIATWFKIVNYYTKAAPGKLAIPMESTTLLKDWGIFKLRQPQGINREGATTTMLAFDTLKKQLYSADAHNNMYRWTNGLRSELLAKLPSPATDAVFLSGATGERQMQLTCIGALAPVDADTGKVLRITLGGKSRLHTIADKLPRPVQSIAIDADNDGVDEYIVCGFGHNNGGLYLLKQISEGQFKKDTISPMPGVSHVVAGDFNRDGFVDFVCLFAQGDEGIWLFTNNRKGGFAGRNLLRFPPVYGSSSFQLADINHDGALDILYTAGDNADLSPIPKPYHGIYIFMNDGQMHFTQKYFYHMNGCTKAILADFKKNGSTDIVAIAFFTAKGKTEQSFVYLEQSFGLKFQPHQLPIANYGKWLTMDVNDYNGDGYLDVALGSCSFNNLDSNSKENTIDKAKYTSPLIILQNQSGQLKPE